MRVVGKDYEHYESYALRHGGEGVGHVRWHIAPWCASPVQISLQRSRTIMDGVLDILAGCRKCSGCLKRRASQWRARATAEWTRSGRTWLWTGTYGGKLRRSRRTDPGARSEGLRQGSADVTKWLKRLRKGTGSFRYLIVPEPQESGVLHWHALVHTSTDLRYRALMGRWGLGFESAKLVGSDYGATYVAKYLSKGSMGTRIRCSKAYGRPPGIVSGCERGKILQHISEEKKKVPICVATLKDVIDLLYSHGYIVDMSWNS